MATRYFWFDLRLSVFSCSLCFVGERHRQKRENEMNAPQAIQCIAGELLAIPAEIFELISSEPELSDNLKAFLANKIDYDTLRDTVSEYI